MRVQQGLAETLSLGQGNGQHGRACNKDIDVAQVGESALPSHASGDRHKKHEQYLSGTFTNFFISEEGN